CFSFLRILFISELKKVRWSLALIWTRPKFSSWEGFARLMAFMFFWGRFLGGKHGAFRMPLFGFSRGERFRCPIRKFICLMWTSRDILRFVSPMSLRREHNPKL